MEDLAQSLRVLAERQGPELALVLVGEQAIVDPGGVAGDPVAELERALPPGTLLLVLVGPDAPRSPWMTCLDVIGPPWRVQGESESAPPAPSST